jgi:hypothetical protein
MTSAIQIAEAIRHLSTALSLRVGSSVRLKVIEAAVAEAKLAAILAAEEELTRDA